MFIYLTANWVEDVSRSLRYLFIYFLVWLFWQMSYALFTAGRTNALE